jgi:hypothetical protein
VRDAVGRARLGEDDRLAALRELDRQSRALEAAAAAPNGEAPSLDDLFARERRRSASLGGRTVFDDRAASRRSAPAPVPSQLALPGLDGPRRR